MTIFVSIVTRICRRYGGPLVALAALTSFAAHAQEDDGTAAFQRGDYVAAHEAWLPFAEQGDAIAQYRLGFLYEEGRGVPPNDSLAAIWYRDAAGRGERRATEALARINGW